MSEPILAPDLKTYKGNCHCGAFKFSIKIPELTSLTECNCSICFKKGYKWIFPGNGDLTVEKGEGSLTTYKFGKQELVHKFCPTCGTGVMRQKHDGMEVAVNAGALKDVDIWALKIDKYDGAALEPFYSPPAFTGQDPQAQIDNCILYIGSCHCGVVSITLKNSGQLVQKVAPFEPADGVIGECDCSICGRISRVLTYRTPDRISIHLKHGSDLSSYSFGSMQFSHNFCSVCGVAVGVDDAVENMKAVNLRCLEGVHWNGIETYKHRGSAEGPAYVVPE